MQADYIEATKDLYKEAALTPEIGLCCTTNPIWQFPDLNIPKKMIDMNYGCGTTVNPRDLINNPTVLYVGVGGGMELLQFAYFSRKNSGVIGIDIVDEMIESANKNISEAEIQNKWFSKDIIDIKNVTFICDEPKKHSQNIQEIRNIANGVFTARDLVWQPPNILYPSSFADECKKLKKIGVKVTIYNEKQLEKLGMEALLAVGRGSRKDSRVVVMEWSGAKKVTSPMAFVGKGVCFDSGGLSLKPSKSMEDMKWDMGGAATVTGLIEAAALSKIKQNLIGVIGLVENMPDGDAQRPGDVIKSLSGQTIEVLNTDAEGRLVLADILSWTEKKYKPKFMIDLATLTGAMIVALGNTRAGLFSNNKEISKAISSAGEITGEKVWEMPLDDDYDQLIKTEIADMKNIGGAGAGSITAACFLKRHVKKTPWACLLYTSDAADE